VLDENEQLNYGYQEVARAASALASLRKRPSQLTFFISGRRYSFISSSRGS